jgi:hypothetical protein
MAEPAPPDLYDRDFYTWTQEQAKRLRELRSHNTIDIEHVAAEIEDLGASARKAVESHLELTLVHLIKLARSPAGEPRGHWFDEVIHHQSEAERSFSAGMRQALDMDRIWRKAVRRAHLSLTHHDEPGIDRTPPNPFALDDLLAEMFDPDVAERAVRAAMDDQERSLWD